MLTQCVCFYIQKDEQEATVGVAQAGKPANEEKHKLDGIEMQEAEEGLDKSLSSKVTICEKGRVSICDGCNQPLSWKESEQARKNNFDFGRSSFGQTIRAFN